MFIITLLSSTCRLAFTPRRVNLARENAEKCSGNRKIKGGNAEKCVKRKYGKTEFEFYWSSFGRYLQKRAVLKQRLIFSGHVLLLRAIFLHNWCLLCTLIPSCHYDNEHNACTLFLRFPIIHILCIPLLIQPISKVVIYV